MKKKLIIVCTVLLLVALVMCGCTDLFTTKRNYYTIDSSSLENLNVAEVVANNAITATVRIVTSKKGFGDDRIVGAGFAITADGYVITNAHVIKPSSYGDAALEYLVQFVDGTSSPAAYVDSNSAIDIGILKINSAVASAGKIPHLQVSTDDLKFGQSVYTIGNPDNLGFVFSGGFVANPSFKISSENKGEDNYGILLDMSVNHGNSGGVLLDNRGAVVGVVSSRIESSASTSTTNGVYVNEIYGLGIAVKASTMVSYLDEIGVVYTKYTVPTV